MQHTCHDLVNLFNELFASTEQTVLVGGASEPLYRPSTPDELLHQVIFTHDYYASALHEIAHWCIAGKERRQLVDYGYWYKPDGRNLAEQILFEQVEVKPQAIEWHFSLAAGVNFNISLDNLAGETHSTSDFQQKVYQQAWLYFETGLPLRAEKFKNRLLEFYDRSAVYYQSLLGELA
ncbi:MAG: transporting ATPase [Gammaproteobacteria bacterium]|jgi:elongation factor P hydroxylase|nr:transporting ATPase [Gammaproteobacteria bacterium]